MRALLAIGQSTLHLVNRLNRWLYSSGARKTRRLPRPVISIGNIAMGGSGKTPTTIAIARLLLSRNVRPAILTRGYGRTSTDNWLVVDEINPARFGDEPSLMFRQFEGDVPIIVGSKRLEAATAWLQDNDSGDCDVFLLDDGFQHLSLHRDLDIVLDVESEWSRETRSTLSHADLVIRRFASVEERDDLAEPSEPAAILTPRSIWHSGSTHELSLLDGQRILGFSGLANNDQFYDLLHRLGAIVRQFIEFEDHHRYTASDVADLIEKAKGQRVDWIITTEKDWVKTRKFSDEIGFIGVEMILDPIKPILDKLNTLLPTQVVDGR